MARAGAAPLFPDRPALAPAPYLPPRLPMQSKDAIGHTSCPSDLAQFFSLQLAAQEKASPPSSADSLETWRHRGSRYWRTPGTATAHFRRRRRLCPLWRSQPPPPFHHGCLCVVWGEAGPLIALLPHPYPLRAGFQGTAFPNPAGEVSHPHFRARTPSHTSRGRNLGSPPLRIRSQRIHPPLLQGGSLAHLPARHRLLVYRTSALSLCPSTATAEGAPREPRAFPLRRKGGKVWKAGPVASFPLVPLAPCPWQARVLHF